jgi:enoyl-CoA hydratase/carnithine racemase
MQLYTAEQTALIHQHTFAHLLIDEQQHILTLTLNRPDKKNALNPTLVNELAYALAYAHYNKAIWVVVLRANGTVFCAGADLKAFAGGDADNASTIPQPAQTPLIGNLWAAVHKPCIAQLHAPVYAGGLLLVAGCLYVVAAENVFFELPEVKRGLFPMQVMHSLLRIMPARRVLDWCIRAQRMDAKQALHEGIVTQLVATPNDLDHAVQQLCADICANSPAAIRMGLSAYDGLRHIADSEAHAYLSNMLGQTLQTRDAMEGIMAFQQKRNPIWTGE